MTAGPRLGPPGPMGVGHPRHRRGSSRPGTERAYCEPYGCCEGRGVAGMVCGAAAGVPLHQETRRFWAYWCGLSRSTGPHNAERVVGWIYGLVGCQLRLAGQELTRPFLPLGRGQDRRGEVGGGLCEAHRPATTRSQPLRPDGRPPSHTVQGALGTAVRQTSTVASAVRADVATDWTRSVI